MPDCALLQINVPSGLSVVMVVAAGPEIRKNFDDWAATRWAAVSTANTTIKFISVNPPIFALAEIVFIAAETVTPPAPATSGKSSDRIHRIMQN